tara:strand:+ start:1722 stop:1889 length:168 start_codon:yes stop_codon:yes gene_type:complete
VSLPFFCFLFLNGFLVCAIVQVFGSLMRGDPQSKRINKRNMRRLAQPFQRGWMDD